MTSGKPDLDQGDSTVEDCQRTARKNLLCWDRGILHEELRTRNRDTYTLLFEKHSEGAVRVMVGKLTEAKKAKREAKQHIQDLASAGSCWELGTQGNPDLIHIKLGKYHKIETLTYRFVYQVYNGIFLETEEFVRHQCSNRACIRPSHLLAGSDRQNREDEVSRVYSGRGAKGKGQELEFESDIELSLLKPYQDEYLERGIETDVRNPVGREKQDSDQDELSHLLE
jgi:hypothetical protein